MHRRRNVARGRGWLAVGCPVRGWGQAVRVGAHARVGILARGTLGPRTACAEKRHGESSGYFRLVAAQLDITCVCVGECV